MTLVIDPQLDTSSEIGIAICVTSFIQMSAVLDTN